MEIEEIGKKINKVAGAKEIFNEENQRLDDIATDKMNEINHRLLDIVANELKNDKVPSKEVLDTLHTSLILTAALPPILFK